MLQNLETANSVVATNMAKVGRNIERIRKLISKDTTLMYVAKSNGYGHGLVEPTLYMRDHFNIHHFATGMVSEALDLREAGLNDYLMLIGGISEKMVPYVIRYDLCPTVYENTLPVLLDKEAAKQGKKCHVHLKIETGLCRLGAKPGKELATLIDTVKSCPNLVVDGVSTHLAQDYTKDQSYSDMQLDRFDEAIAQVKAAGIQPLYCHAGATGGILNVPRTRNYSMVRIAALIFGYDITPSDPENRYGFEPAMEWTSTVMNLRTVEDGEKISYSPFIETKRKTVVAILGFGMGDGYIHELVTQDLEHNSYVLIRGKRAKLLDLHMDQTYADVTDIPGVTVGDTVTIVGKDGMEEITTMGLAKISGTSSGHICCSITGRPFRYCKKGE